MSNTISTNKSSLPSSSSSGININSPPSIFSVTNTADNLSNWVAQDFDFIEESLEEVKLKASGMISEVQRERKKLEEVMLLPEGTEGRESQLRELINKACKLKFDVPFKFIPPSQQANPNVNWRPRPNPNQIKEITPSSTTLLSEEIVGLLHGLHESQINLLLPFLHFPPNAIIKRSILFGWSSFHFDEVLQFNWHINELIAKGFIEAVQKKCSSTAARYRMHHSTHSILCRGFMEDSLAFGMRLGPSTNKEEKDYDIFYTSGGKFPVNHLYILHLGKWKKSSTQHIEFIDNPDLFFKDLSNLRDLNKLRYISLRGISMIEELPKSITNFKSLLHLDVQACYNLEVIPPDITNLRYCLEHLDMSECYFLEHMPKALATLRELRVLKGFFVGKIVDETTCTLEDLLPLPFLEKLNIYTSVKEFPNASQLEALQSCRKLLRLTISWGGCKSKDPKDTTTTTAAGGSRLKKLLTNSGTAASGKVGTFPFNLEKLDLQCVPETVTRVWLNPINFRKLKRLYIRGGDFSDLGQSLEECHWDVEIFRLKHLRKLKLDWSELHHLFPKLICLENFDCPHLSKFPRDEDGVWTKDRDAELSQAALHASRSA